jgi:hypothetical protein
MGYATSPLIEVIRPIHVSKQATIASMQNLPTITNMELEEYEHHTIARLVSR